MKQVIVNLFKFDELSEKSQSTAIVNVRQDIAADGLFIPGAEDTFNKFEATFSTLLNHEYLSEIERNPLRMRKYLINNFYEVLYSKRFLGRLSNDKFVYSNIQLDTDCTLTGVCYDLDILSPIRGFVESPFKISFNDLYDDCINNLNEAIEKEQDYLLSTNAIIDSIKTENLDFLEDGTVWNL